MYVCKAIPQNDGASLLTLGERGGSGEILTCLERLGGPLPFRLHLNLLADISEGGAEELAQQRKEYALACTPLPNKDQQHLKGVT
jgi:hypothetical protein